MLKDIGAALVAMGPLWEFLGKVATVAIKLIVADLRFVWEVVSGTVGLITALIRGDWDAAWSSFKRIALAPVNLVLRRFEAFGIDLPATMKAAANGVLAAVEGMANGVIGGINGIIGAWNALEFRLPGKKVFGKTVIPEINIGTPDIPLIPTVSVPRLRDGGITNGPTLAIVGDNPGGRELITPLPPGSSGMPGTVINNYIKAGNLLTSRRELDMQSVRANSRYQRRLTGALI